MLETFWIFIFFKKFKQLVKKVSRHAAAREMVTVAEGSLKASKSCRPDEKAAWAEMLNSATEKVNSAEIERLAADREHTERLHSFQVC